MSFEIEPALSWSDLKSFLETLPVSQRFLQLHASTPSHLDEISFVPTPPSFDEGVMARLDESGRLSHYLTVGEFIALIESHGVKQTDFIHMVSLRFPLDKGESIAVEVTESAGMFWLNVSNIDVI